MAIREQNLSYTESLFCTKNILFLMQLFLSDKTSRIPYFVDHFGFSGHFEFDKGAKLAFFRF